MPLALWCRFKAEAPVKPLRLGIKGMGQQRSDTGVFGNSDGTTRSKYYGNQRAKDWGVSDRARILCTDYREIPRQKFDRIVSLEMVEHVGVKNLVGYYEIVRDYGAKNGYSLVLEASSGALLYADKAVDVTDEIVKLHNASPHAGTRGSKSKE